MLELTLRILGTYKTYSENTRGVFYSYYNQVDTDGLWTWPPLDTFLYKQSEFEYYHFSNSLGLREKELPIEKPDNVVRIITVGDSYTEGDGVDYEYSYPKALETLLNNNLHNSPCQYEILNAGVSGSDIVFINEFLERELIKYKPDAVIYLLNTSDIDDIIYRGGEERYQNDGSANFRKGPWFLLLYRSSHCFRAITRVFISTNENLLSDKIDFQLRKKALQIFYKQIERSKSYLTLNSIHSVFFIHPTPASIDNSVSKYELDSISTSDPLNLDFSSHTEINELIFFDSNSISLFEECYDSFHHLSLDTYSWPINGHFNEFGYRTLARIIFDKIKMSHPELIPCSYEN